MRPSLPTLLILTVLIISAAHSEGRCLEGDVQRDECSTCVCQHGTFSCIDTCSTVPHRFQRSVPVAVDLKSTPCAPNDYFKLDCNTCYCNIDQTGYLCTENICPITTTRTNFTLADNRTARLVNETLNLTSANLTLADNQTTLLPYINVTLNLPGGNSTLAHNQTTLPSYVNKTLNLPSANLTFADNQTTHLRYVNNTLNLPLADNQTTLLRFVNKTLNLISENLTAADNTTAQLPPVNQRLNLTRDANEAIDLDSGGGRKSHL